MLKIYRLLHNRGLRVVTIGIFSIIFAISIYSFLSSNQSSVDVSRLYNLAIADIFLILVSLSAIGYGLYLAFHSESTNSGSNKDYLAYISRILTDKTCWRIFIISSIVYGIFFGFLSQIIIYHENVEGDIVPSISITLCCNYPGYVPMITILLSDTFSILIIPLNLILAISISLMVGFNFALNIYFLRMYRYQSQKKFPAVSTFGIFTGLFVGCPTCAGSLFSLILGFGTSAAISGLAPFQSLFMAISIPILLGIPFLLIRKIVNNEKCDIIGNK